MADDAPLPPAETHYKNEDIEKLISTWLALQADASMEHTDAWRKAQGLSFAYIVYEGKVRPAYITSDGKPYTKQFTKKNGETVTYPVPVEVLLPAEVKPRPEPSYPYGNAQPGRKFPHSKLATAAMEFCVRSISAGTSPEAAALSKPAFDDVLGAIESFNRIIFTHMSKYAPRDLLWTQPPPDSADPPKKRVTPADFEAAVRELHAQGGKCVWGRPPGQLITYDLMCKIRQQNNQPPPSKDEFEEFASLIVDAYFSEVVFGTPNVKALDKTSEREAPPVHRAIVDALKAHNATDTKFKRVYKHLSFSTPSGARLPLSAFNPDTVFGGMLCIARLKLPTPLVTAAPSGKGNTLPVGQPLAAARLPRLDPVEFVVFASRAPSKKEESSNEGGVNGDEEDAEYEPDKKKRTTLADFAQRIKRPAESDGENPPKRVAPGPTPDFPDNH